MIIVGIAGGSGSGKTYMANQIKDRLSDKTLIFPMDNYYKPFSDKTRFERMQINFDRPEALDWNLMKQHLTLLRQGKSVNMPEYSYKKSTRTGTRKVEPRDIVVVDGMYALYDKEIRSKMDLKVFMDPDPDIRALQRVKRDVKDRDRDIEFAVKQYLEKTKQMHEEKVSPTKEHADFRLGRSDSTEFLEKVVEIFRGKELKSGRVTEYLKEEF
ncbi:MAG: uridine kinase [Candidatus Nanohaloarchaea archaeon]|nr:uridine kinase [Candidatus Nanohaloarchaea archaeon]